MRTIKYIILHHSITPRDLDGDKSLQSFNKNHERLKKQGQPDSGTQWNNIGYHYVISGDGTVYETRKQDIVGYHASSLTVNNQSLGICLIGDFDKEEPSSPQLDKLRSLIFHLTEEFGVLEILPHRAFAKKSCPGKNFTQELIDSLNNRSEFQIYRNWWKSIGGQDKDWKSNPNWDEVIKAMNLAVKSIDK